MRWFLAVGLLAGCASAGSDPVVAVGVEHACAIASGELTCWGSDERRQRGRDLGSLPSLVAVAAGGNTTCVVAFDGGVYCFGQAHRGQLGDGAFEDSATPHLVGGLPPAIGVSVGFAHACAWSATGEVCCWGWNGSGQADPDAASADVLVPTCRARDAARVVAGFDTTCVLDRRGGLACFGGHDVVVDLARDVALGADHACVLGADALTCHGAEPGGAGEPLAEPRVIPFLGGALAAGGIDHLCVTDAQGSLHCMGKNDHGQLGDGSFAQRPMPVRVRGLAAVGSVGVGDRHSCAVAEGRVYCWGWNDVGQLGDETGVHSLDPHPVAAVWTED